MTRSRRVAFVSIDPTWEDPSGDFVPFTYAVRKLEASLRSAPDLADVETRIIDLQTADPDAFFEEIRSFRPTLVAASLYLWSIGAFQELARRVRAWDPSVRIVAGGPHARASVFNLPNYRDLRTLLDAAVTGEGEEILRDIVRTHLEGGWTKLPGLTVPSPLGWRSTGPLERPVLDAYPSPYHIDTAPPRTTGYIETFRGCPIHCSFCQWGEQRADRVHSAEYLAAHLEGLRRAEVPNVFFIDAAFNLSPRAFRALVEAEGQVGFLAQTTIHGHIYPTFLKDEHLELLTSAGKAQVSIGIQSFSPSVLHRLGRPFDLERFERVLAAMRGRIPIDLELMLGLPGDDPRAFRDTFERAVEIADTIRVFKTLVLPDALLDRADASLAIDFDPDTFLLRSCAGWRAEDIDREFEHVQRVALAHDRVTLGETWVGFGVRRDSPVQAPRREGIETMLERGVPEVPIEVIEQLRRAVAASAGGWRLRTVRHHVTGLEFDLDAPSGRVLLEAFPLRPGAKWFAARDGVAYSYRGEVGPHHFDALQGVVDLVHGQSVALITGG